MITQITFEYDETQRKWSVSVKGVRDSREAQQAFTAVVMTCQQVDPNLQRHALVDQKGDTYNITPAVL